MLYLRLNRTKVSRRQNSTNLTRVSREEGSLKIPQAQGSLCQEQLQNASLSAVVTLKMVEKSLASCIINKAHLFRGSLPLRYSGMVLPGMVLPVLSTSCTIEHKEGTFMFLIKQATCSFSK